MLGRMSVGLKDVPYILFITPLFCMRQSKRATLVLEDGTKFEGKSFGYEAATAGEVVLTRP